MLAVNASIDLYVISVHEHELLLRVKRGLRIAPSNSPESASSSASPAPAGVQPGAPAWGRVIAHRTRPQAGKRWTDTGLLHGDRGLKNRP